MSITTDGAMDRTEDPSLPPFSMLSLQEVSDLSTDVETGKLKTKSLAESLLPVSKSDRKPHQDRVVPKSRRRGKKPRDVRKYHTVDTVYIDPFTAEQSSPILPESLGRKQRLRDAQRAAKEARGQVRAERRESRRLARMKAQEQINAADGMSVQEVLDATGEPANQTAQLSQQVQDMAAQGRCNYAMTLLPTMVST